MSFLSPPQSFNYDIVVFFAHLFCFLDLCKFCNIKISKHFIELTTNLITDYELRTNPKNPKITTTIKSQSRCRRQPRPLLPVPLSMLPWGSLGEVKVIELIAIILDHVVVFPFLGRRSLITPGARTVARLRLRGRGIGRRFWLVCVVLAACQAFIGTLRVDHIVGFISINFTNFSR